MASYFIKTLKILSTDTSGGPTACTTSGILHWMLTLHQSSHYLDFNLSFMPVFCTFGTAHIDNLSTDIPKQMSTYHLYGTSCNSRCPQDTSLWHTHATRQSDTNSRHTVKLQDQKRLLCESQVHLNALNYTSGSSTSNKLFFSFFFFLENTKIRLFVMSSISHHFHNFFPSFLFLSQARILGVAAPKH